jgi:eukaryotic-like serine/threonine-protein kinase
LIDGDEGLKEREERIPAVWREKRPAQAGARIVELYDAWGKPDKAARWRAKLGLADLPADVFSQ